MDRFASYPLLTISPQRPHWQLKEKPAGPAGRYSRLDHHGVRVSVWSVSVQRLLSRHRQTGCFSLSIRLHGSLPPIVQPVSPCSSFECVQTFFVDVSCTLSVRFASVPVSFSGGGPHCGLQPILCRLSYCFLRRSVCE